MNKRPSVGIAVFIIKDGTFLMEYRKSSHGNGMWSVPGGWLEYGESFEDAAKREVLEETGLSIKDVTFCAVTNNVFQDEDKHSITVWMTSHWMSGESTIMEPEKCGALEWRDFDSLPEPLFLPWQELLNSSFLKDIKEKISH